MARVALSNGAEHDLEAMRAAALRMVAAEVADTEVDSGPVL